MLYLSWSYYRTFAQGNVRLFASFSTGNVGSFLICSPGSWRQEISVVSLVLSFEEHRTPNHLTNICKRDLSVAIDKENCQAPPTAAPNG